MSLKLSKYGKRLELETQAEIGPLPVLSNNPIIQQPSRSDYFNRMQKYIDDLKAGDEYLRVEIDSFEERLALSLVIGSTSDKQPTERHGHHHTTTQESYDAKIAEKKKKAEAATQKEEDEEEEAMEQMASEITLHWESQISQHLVWCEDHNACVNCGEEDAEHRVEDCAEPRWFGDLEFDQ